MNALFLLISSAPRSVSSLPNVTINVPSSPPSGDNNTGGSNGQPGPGKTSSLGPILGGALGGVAIVALAAGTFFILHRMLPHHRRVDLDLGGPDAMSQHYVNGTAALTAPNQPHTPSLSPFSDPRSPAVYITTPTSSDHHSPFTQRNTAARAGVTQSYEMQSDAVPSLSPISEPASMIPAVSASSSVLRPSRRYPLPPSPVLGRHTKQQEAAPADAHHDDWMDVFFDGESAGTETEVGGLREEMAALRQQMEHMRQMQWAPPPQYEAA